MEGPTPVSAFLHSATMVVIGVYLLFKLSYLFISIINLYTYIIIIIGVFTILISSFNGIFSNDLKSILASSTSGQIGYMFLALGFLHN
jgi:NADH:ubiquinone oxidoreductase subunit 5 (subunit L)/multisubunit Na+/H+ antiporter MnhA subunit